MFFHFWQNIRKFKMAAIFGGGENFLKIAEYDKIALSRTVKQIEANLCFAIFGKYSKIQNGRHFWGGENFLKTAKITFLRYPVGENFDEIALSRTVKEIEANLCFAIFGKNSKIQNGCHFWGGKIFFLNCIDYIP